LFSTRSFLSTGITSIRGGRRGTFV
jgi:hypothetical protein